MTNVDDKTVKAFCSHCDWAYQCWLMRKHLYDENPKKKLLNHPHHRYFFIRLGKILQEYWLQEVAKLHDPKTLFGHDNLSVEYILEHGNWAADAEKRLRNLKVKMDRFADPLKDPRNKLLSHKDKNTIVSELTLGEFQAGEDVAYFDALSEFASEVHEQKLGDPYLFDDLTKNDIEIFMAAFGKGIA